MLVLKRMSVLFSKRTYCVLKEVVTSLSDVAHMSSLT